MSRTSRSRPGAAAPGPAATRAKPPAARAQAPAEPRPARQAKRSEPPPRDPVPEGIEYHLRVLRAYGALAALVPMVFSGLLSLLVLWGSQSTIRGIVGFVLAVMSCPTLPVFGLPVSAGGGRWLAVIASSAILWGAIGFVAARRSTTRAVAGWREWRREWLRLAIGVWAGSLVGFAIAAILLTVDF